MEKSYRMVEGEIIDRRRLKEKRKAHKAHIKLIQENYERRRMRFRMGWWRPLRTQKKNEKKSWKLQKKRSNFVPTISSRPLLGLSLLRVQSEKFTPRKKRASSIITIIICKHLKFRSREDEKNATNANNLALSRRPSTECSSEIFFVGEEHTQNDASWAVMSHTTTYTCSRATSDRNDMNSAGAAHKTSRN